jgi:hypothetical protein
MMSRRKTPIMDSDAYLEQIEAVVQEKGWAIQTVYSTMTAQTASYAYTIGLVARGYAAEVLISGLPVSLASDLLNEIAVAMTENSGMPPANWDVSGGKGEYIMLPVWLTRPTVEVSVNVACRFYKADNIPVVQYVWPAANGSYPWDAQWPGHVYQPVRGMGIPPS